MVEKEKGGKRPHRYIACRVYLGKGGGEEVGDQSLIHVLAGSAKRCRKRKGERKKGRGFVLVHRTAAKSEGGTSLRGGYVSDVARKKGGRGRGGKVEGVDRREPGRSCSTRTPKGK